MGKWSLRPSNPDDSGPRVTTFGPDIRATSWAAVSRLFSVRERSETARHFGNSERLTGGHRTVARHPEHESESSPMATHEELREYVARARDTSDPAAMCKIGLYNEHSARRPDIASRWFALAAERDFVPAFHELVRVATLEQRFDEARTLLQRVTAILESGEPGGQGESPPVPACPLAARVDADWLLHGEWTGSRSWVSVSPQVLGTDLYGQAVGFDSDDVSMTAEVIAVVTSETDRAEPILNTFAQETVMHIDWRGEWVTFEQPGRPHIAYATSADYGVRLDFDAKGEVPAPQGRAIVQAAAELLAQKRIAAHVTNHADTSGHPALALVPTDPT